MGGAVAEVSEGTTYTSADLTVLVPTLNRPAKLTRLFESLEAQSEQVGRVILVDGAESAQAVVATFADRIPVEYFRCIPPSQIRQRNHGLAQLQARDRLIVFLDDDMVLEPEAIREMVRFWNIVEAETAGICFNIVNGEPERRTILNRLVGLTTIRSGVVLRSGLTTAVTHMDESIRVQWLPGGATVWRKEVLLDHPYREVSSRWAIAEDLIFSYPVGKRLPLYVCATARARHEHVYDHRPGMQQWYHGRTQTLWTYYFVSTNRELSKALFFWTLGLRMAGKLVRAVIRRDRNSLDFVRGQAAAVMAILRNAAFGGATRDLREEPSESEKTAMRGGETGK